MEGGAEVHDLHLEIYLIHINPIQHSLCPVSSLGTHDISLAMPLSSLKST